MTFRRPLLLPFLPLYSVALRIKSTLYDRGLLQMRSLGRPVISVGSLSAGGAGKTPVVLLLAELLSLSGLNVAVLSRGYGRRSGVVEKVDPMGPASRYGDESLLMAQAGQLVFVGADRYAAGSLAESTSATDVHLLDDGFQHRRLARTVDIVLLTCRELNDSLLPVGNLREPLAALNRAQIVILRKEETRELQSIVAANSRAEIWIIERKLSLPEVRPARPLVFCGIARPQDFLEMLQNSGCKPVGAVLLPDHHSYVLEDFHRLLESARKAGADGFCTTTKDAVKISQASLEELESLGPVMVAQLQVSLENEENAMLRLHRLLQPA